ncbi:hypothetical protein GGR34_001216 [Microvirga flocculans]|uniref:Uncharacterized protein n=1 Tax=Microvirga flocculans TaxID=217168 RepID=A0A7W6IDS9_9HYPH|nr:hypothetical protein [Microvirga flocculans]
MIKRTFNRTAFPVDLIDRGLAAIALTAALTAFFLCSQLP